MPLSVRESMTEVVETDSDGTKKVIVTDAKVIRGTVERVTGAGNVVVYPALHDADVKKGEEALIVTDKTMAQKTVYTLEFLKEHVTSPYNSEYAIIVRGQTTTLERCRVYFEGTPLSAVDTTGVPRTELPLPLGGWLSFRIPADTKVTRDSWVELRDGEAVVLRETIGALPGAAVL
jgi:hypothetical protein